MAAPPDENKRSPLKAWVRALERTAGIGRDPTATFPQLVGKLGERFGPAPALISRELTLSYRDLAAASNRIARWGLAQGLRSGDVAALVMGNCPQYLATWIGLTRIGVTVALVNTNLRGTLLAHSLGLVAPRCVITGADLAAAVCEVRAQLTSGAALWSDAATAAGLPGLAEATATLPGEALTDREAALPRLDERALFIYTSGTTGLPKAAVVSHRRLMQWSHWFAGLIDTQPHDRMYDCLPLYHSVGGVVAPGATLVGGGAVVLRERFSASSFWPDVAAERCTLFQYIGELCRYLLGAPRTATEAAHSLRLACGNGLRPEVWAEFQQRFRIPQILEYYASTEGNFSLYNCEGRVGAIGRIPPFLAHRVPVALVQFDPETNAPLRDAAGHCVRCAPGEVGEALGQVLAASPATRFEGYTDATASAAKILRDVFVPGDAWYRTGDLMRQDEQGFFYFVDRAGDTFRWKGENVSTTEVAGVLAACAGVAEVAVYGVRVPGAEGRAGMAAIVAGSHFDLAELRRELVRRLPAYARPVFIRMVQAIELTGTFKLRKQQLATEGCDPARTSDPLYVDDAAGGAYVRFGLEQFALLQSGALRL